MSAVKFKTLTLRNFMSYGNNTTIINLDFDEPILIIGKNQDAVVNGQIDSNGAGKSAILDALAFALFDKTISNKEKPKLINNINKKNMEVSVTFEKDKMVYRITRIRKTKTKADVKLEFTDGKHDWKDITRDSISNTNDEVERIIGLPFDVFARIIVFSANFEPFLDLPSRHASKPNQTDIMEELFGYTELTEKANVLKEKIKGNKAEFAHQEELASQITKEIERHESQLQAAQDRLEKWEQEHATKLEQQKEELAVLKKIDVEKERMLLEELAAIKQKLFEAESEHSSLKTSLQRTENRIKQYENLKEKYEDAVEKLKLLSKFDLNAEEKIIEQIDNLKGQKPDELKYTKKLSEKERLKARIVEIVKELEVLESNECPYCHQEYQDTKNKILELNKEKCEDEVTIEDIDLFIADFEKELEKIDNNIKELKEKSSIKADPNTLHNLKQRKVDAESIISSYENMNVDDHTKEMDQIKEETEDAYDKVTKLKKEVEKCESACTYTSLGEVEKINARIESLRTSIENLEKEENPHSETIQELKDVTFDNEKTELLNELKDTIEHQEFLLKLLTKKDSFVRKNLLDQSLPFLNKRLMMYLTKLGLPHRVEFQPDMTANISQFGTELDFGSLSSGQRARVNLALAFAFRDVLQARHGKIDFCMLDECLDTGLGNVGVQLAAKMIKEIASEGNMSMFVISHRDEIASMFKNQMVVELKNGFSRIIDKYEHEITNDSDRDEKAPAA